VNKQHKMNKRFTGSTGDIEKELDEVHERQQRELDEARLMTKVSRFLYFYSLS
jgi:hypothetical protein